MRKIVLITILFFAFSGNLFSQLLPNQKISGGKKIYTSKGEAAFLIDNKFNNSSWNASANSWIAIQLDSGPSRIFFNWNNPSYPWSNELAPSNCPNSIYFPVDYNLLISSNSTNGNDGDWIIADSIRKNIVSARGHLIDFTGAKWLKMQIIKGGGQIDEIQVFDASKGDEDVWFFAGTSISANAFKGTPPSKNYADLVTEKHPDYNPAMIRGGIGCISSSDFVGNLPKYLKMAGNAHFWAIEMGTNDAWNGSNGNVTTFKNNLQIVIDSCKARGIEPVIARVLATNEIAAKWQIHPDFLKAVDDLTVKNKLIPGPDLFTWFLTHPADLNSDGVHPGAAGAASIQRLWAEKMDSLYGGCSATDIIPYIRINRGEISLLATASAFTGDTVIFSPTAGSGGSWLWNGPNEFSSTSREIILNSIQLIQAGNYTMTYQNKNGCESNYTVKVTVKNREDVITSDKASGISLYPNPTSDSKFVVVLNIPESNSLIQIFDILGKIAFESVLTQKETEIDAGLTKGTYIVQVKNGQYSLKTKLMVK
jgi:lysophospholipase L1-like esterase